MAIDWAEITVFVCPVVPDFDIVFFEGGDVGIACQEPEEFVDDRTEVEFFGGDDRKARGLPGANFMFSGSGGVWIEVIVGLMPED